MKQEPKMSDEQTDGCRHYHQWIEELFGEEQADELGGSKRELTDEV
jgi:hypothetical protein